MYKISNDIYNSINSTVNVKEVSCDMCNQILEKIIELYVDNEKKELWLWDKLNNYEALSDSRGWTYIQNFVLDENCIMFFNQDEEKKMFIISNGKDLQYVLSETSGFEFYITDINCSYLICFNHHDILYGCGKAKKWIAGLKKHYRK